MLDNLIDQLKKEMELDEIQTEVPGVWTLPLEDRKIVTISSVPHGFVLECRFGSYPEENALPFFTHALHADLFCEGSESAILGIDDSEKTLVLSRVIETETNFSTFKEIVEDFLNSVDFWEEEASSYTNRETAPS